MFLDVFELAVRLFKDPLVLLLELLDLLLKLFYFALLLDDQAILHFDELIVLHFFLCQCLDLLNLHRHLELLRFLLLLIGCLLILLGFALALDFVLEGIQLDLQPTVLLLSLPGLLFHHLHAIAHHLDHVVLPLKQCQYLLVYVVLLIPTLLRRMVLIILDVLYFLGDGRLHVVEQLLHSLIPLLHSLFLRFYLILERVDLHCMLVFLLLQSLREEALLLAQDHDLVVQVLLVYVLEFGG